MTVPADKKHYESWLRRAAQLPLETRNNIRIADLALSTRAHTALSVAGIGTVGDLRLLTVEQLAEVRNIGTNTRTEILATLSKLGVVLLEQFDLSQPASLVVYEDDR